MANGNGTNYPMYAFLVSLIVIMESTAQFHLKKSQEHNSIFFLIIGIVFYIGVCLSLRKTYEYEGMGLTNFAWSIVSIISMMAIGNLYFGEEINIYDVIGILICTLGLYMVFIYGHSKK